MTQPQQCDAARPLGRVALTRDPGNALWVSPPEADPAPFERFRLPAFEGLHLSWMYSLAGYHLATTGRCLAALLLLDVQDQGWRWCLPWQRCGPEAASWQPDRRDGLPIEPHHRLAGSFQSLAIADQADVPLYVPQLAGVHFVIHYWQGLIGTWAFAHLGGDEAVPMNVTDLATDHLAGVLEAFAPMLQPA